MHWRKKLCISVCVLCDAVSILKFFFLLWFSSGRVFWRRSICFLFVVFLVIPIYEITYVGTFFFHWFENISMWSLFEEIYTDVIKHNIYFCFCFEECTYVLGLKNLPNALWYTVFHLIWWMYTWLFLYVHIVFMQKHNFF